MTAPSDSARPPVAAPGPWAFPEPVVTTPDNGLSVLAYHLPGQYVVSARLEIAQSLADEPLEREGVTTIMARMLDEGTSRFDSEAFARMVERKGIGIGLGATESGLSVDLDMPQRFLSDGLDVMAQVLTDPSFPEPELGRVRQQRLAEIGQERASAGHRAITEFVATYFDSTERASRPSGGREVTVSAITRDDVIARHRQVVGPVGASLVIAGDLTGLDAAALAADALGGWAAPDQLAARPPRVAQRAVDAARVVVVDRPGSVQSELVVGWAGPDRRDELGWAAYPVAGFVVGGSPNARLDAVLREDKGYTYGIRAGFRPRRAGGLFLASGSVRTEVTRESIDLMLEILNARDRTFEPDETRAGVDFVSKTAPGRYATAGAVADEASMVAAESLGADFTTRTLQRMAELTPADLDAAYRRWVTGEWTVVVVGDAEQIAEPLRAAGHGAVTVVPA